MVVTKDVLQLEDADARAVKQWAIRTLIEAAMKDVRAESPADKQQRSSAGATEPRARKSTKKARQ